MKHTFELNKFTQPLSKNIIDFVTEPIQSCHDCSPLQIYFINSEELNIILSHTYLYHLQLLSNALLCRKCLKSISHRTLGLKKITHFTTFMWILGYDNSNDRSTIYPKWCTGFSILGSQEGVQA